MNTEQNKRNLNLISGTSTETSSPVDKPSLDFNKVKVGIKTLEDAVLSNVGSLKRTDSRLANKDNVLRAIQQGDLPLMREISDFFFKTNGIYSRLCKYMANLYCYDHFISSYVPRKKNEKKVNKSENEEIENKFNDALALLDNFRVKEFFGKAALKVIRHGSYYGYKIVKDKTHVMIQELPANYCRSRFEVNGRPAVEFNMKYFDEQFKNSEQKMRILKMFPKDFQKGYVLYHEGKLPAETAGEGAGWYLLDPNAAFAFNNAGEEFPLFINVIPYLIDLDEAQDLDRKKMMQKLVKIIVQELPLDKNGDLIFDPDEAADLHNNAVNMLGKAIGVDVLTTFAKAEVIDLADNNSVTSMDELEKVERTVYNASGTAQGLFNADGNIALTNSVINDEASIYNLILQFEDFLNDLLTPFNTKPKKVSFRAQLLKTTVYNYKEVSKLYKELASTGQGSRLLPLVALGQSQSSILANAYFETQVLDLVSLFIPPLTSATMNSDALKTAQGGDSEEKKAGRKEKADNEKSDKTIANRESMD